MEGLDYLPVTVPRTMIGQSYKPSGALDAITPLLALQHGLIPLSINCEELEPRYGIDLWCGTKRALSLGWLRFLVGAASAGLMW